MAMDVKKGSFTAQAGSGTQDITDVGFQPKAYMLWGTSGTATGFASDQTLSIGFTDGTTQTVGSIFADDAVTTTATRRSSDSASLFNEFTTGVTITRTAIHSALLSNGFRISWDAAGGATLIHYLAWGGADITSAKVTNHTFLTGTGNQSYTGVGFVPDFLCLLSANSTGGALGLSLSFGCGVSSSKRWAWSIFGRDGQTMETLQDNQRYQRTNAIFVSTTNAGAEDAFLDLVTMDSDGFTLNQVNGPPANQFASIAFKGGSYDVGFDAKATGVGGVDTITPTATPKLVLVASDGLAASSAVNTNAYISLGAFDSTSEGQIWTGNKDAIEPTEADRSYVTTTSLTADVTQPSTVNDEADGAISGANFTMTWNTNNGGTEEWLWASFGDGPTVAPFPRGMVGRQAVHRAAHY